MSKKLTAAVFLILSLTVILWLATAAAVEPEEETAWEAKMEKEFEDKEVQIHELRKKIQELESALEREKNEEKTQELKVALKEHRQKLERLMGEFRKAQKPKGEFPEIETAIERTEANLKELRHAAEALKEEGAEPKKLEELHQKIDKEERKLEELLALLEKRRAEREKKLEDKETQIRTLKGAIQELESALEREKNEEKAQELKSALKEHRQKLERLMGEFRKAQKPRGPFPEIEMAIERTEANLKELRHAAEALKKEGAEPEKLEAMQKKIAQKERELEELIGRLEKRRAEAERKKAKAPTKLVILSLEHANAQNLSKVIEKFLTPSGIIAADADTNSLVIKDLPAGLEIASKIIKELDVPKKRKPRESQERAASREGVFIGKVLKAGAEALTIETEEGKITLYVPLRQKEDGTWTQFEELSRVTAAIEVGSTVKVEWQRGEEKLWIKRVAKVEK